MNSGCDRTPIPEPHSIVWHPHLTWGQKVIAYLVHFLIPLRSIGQTRIGSAEAKESTEKLRKMIHDNDYKLGGNAIHEWSKASNDCLLAESIGSIPFRNDILKEWNIVDELDVFPKPLNVREEVKVLVRFPSTLLAPEVKRGNILDYSGCVEVEYDLIDLRNFAPDVPILIMYHGGGMMSGGNHDAKAIEEIVTLVQIAEQNNELITISIDYGLSPENIFPTAIIEGLSVIEYLLSNNTRKLHITGLSAGANLSLVTGIESHRRYPGRILSIQSQSPFLNPAGDTMSYYMNQNVFPDIGWLRWSWRAYIGLEPPDSSKDRSEQNDTKLELLLRKNSNYSSWNKWKTKYSSKSLQRLIYPTLDLPSSLNDEKNAPKIIIRVNLADPLYDDGKEIADALKSVKADITFFEDKGLHVDSGFPANVEGLNKVLKLWSDIIFGGGASKNDEI